MNFLFLIDGCGEGFAVESENENPKLHDSAKSRMKENEMNLIISISEAVRELVKIGVIQFDQISVLPKIEALVEEMDLLASELRQKYQSPAAAMEQLNITRALYRKIGLDPTKIRPSSEALLRRVLKGQSLYQINSIVDTCNLCSLSLLLSLGLYDVDKINGSVQLRIGKEGEGYEGIRKEFVHVSGRLTLVDEIGPFGNPSADSERTMITLETTKVLFVIFVPAKYRTALLNQHLDFVETKVKKYHSCQSVLRPVI